MIATLYGASRVAVGLALLLAPRAASPWLGAVARQPDAQSALRVLGARDALLGVAVLTSEGEPAALRRALRLSAAADVTDALVSAVDFVRTRRRGAGLAVLTAVGGAVVGFREAR